MNVNYMTDLPRARLESFLDALQVFVLEVETLQRHERARGGQASPAAERVLATARTIIDALRR